MALTPWNRQEEWYQAMINASTGNYLPSITAQDEGKVLTVENDGSWGVENVPNELPTVGSSDKDKYLHTNGSTGAVEWADAPDGLPAVTDVDAGKVLTVNNSGVWVAANPSSGGGVLVVHQDVDGTLDKTWQEIFDATFAVVVTSNGTAYFKSPVTGISYVDGIAYMLETADESSYTTSSADGYPELEA